MLLPFLFLLLGLYFFLGYRLSRRFFAGNSQKAWMVTIAGAILIFAADHLIGALYAYIWVRVVPKPPALPIISDDVALENIFAIRSPERDKLGAYAHEMVEPEYWRNWRIEMSQIANLPEPGGLLASYAKVQAIVPTEAGERAFDLSIVADASNPACRTFFEFSPQSREQWRKYLAVGSLENAQNARCVAITPAQGIHARHLYRLFSRKANSIERIFGLEEAGSKSVSELPSRKVIAEYRHMVQRGGWVQRTFWTSFSTGMTWAVVFETPGPKPSIRPATPQKVL